MLYSAAWPLAQLLIGVLVFKVFQERDQMVDAFFGKSVIEGGPHSAKRSVALQVEQSLGFGFFNKLCFQVGVPFLFAQLCTEEEESIYCDVKVKEENVTFLGTNSKDNIHSRAGGLLHRSVKQVALIQERV